MAVNVSMNLRNHLIKYCLCSRPPRSIFSPRYVHINSSKHGAASSVSLDEVDVKGSNNPPNKLHQVDDPAFKRIDLTFENASEAYKSRTNSELLRAYMVFQLCSVNKLVEKNKEMMTLARRVFGKRLFERLMKATFYGQFVAGEDEIRIQPVAKKNRGYGVKSILDYSVEMDLSREQAVDVEMEGSGTAVEVEIHEGEETRFRAHREFGDRREKVSSARTYFYKDEKMCDENLKHFLAGIDAVSGATNATGFAAVKLTALGRPQFLLQLSEVLARVREYFSRLSAGYGTGTLQKADFERHLKSFNLGREERQQWFTILDISQDGEIDLLDWHNLLEVHVSLAKLLYIPNLQTGKLEPLVRPLEALEEEQMRNMLVRVDTIAQHATEKDVRVMIDAEQTYFQPAISRLCMEMMRKYNREKALIFNTYQCYLKDTYNMITTDFALSKRENFYFGAKLVRGAYLEQERERAATLGYEDPINPSYDATTAMYERVLTECMEQIQQRPRGEIAIMVASHNENTVRFTLNKMQEYDIHSTDKLICFGQLLGMCDQVSFSLGQAGYSVYKYVPYGPVEEVLPYLSRRAIENKGMLAKVQKEKRLLRSELFKRFKSFQWFYKPTPPEVSPIDELAAAGQKQ